MQQGSTATTTSATGAASSHQHPDYWDAEAEWRTVEDTIEGATKIKERGILYLPRLTGQTDAEYRDYQKRAIYFNTTRRTRDALTGMLMRKKPAITVPEATTTEPLLADITLQGESVNNWIRNVADQVVATGRMASVIDFDPDEQRPYVATYRARDVLNWATSRIGGSRILSMLLVRELEEHSEAFNVKHEYRYRGYRIIDGIAHYGSWRESDTEGPETAAMVPMTRRGIALTRIPAVFHNAAHLGPEIGQVPLYDLAEINLAHYRGSADMENGRHLAGLPTPWATGVDSDSSDLRLGTAVMLTSENHQARFGFLEFTGSGLGELRQGQEEKERHMAALGARLLADQKKDAEAFETVRLRATSENAALSNIAGHLTVTLTQTLQWLAWWESTVETPNEIEASIVLNQDFLDHQMDAPRLSALTQALQQNVISFETFFHALQEGELYPEDWDMEREAAAIAQRPPATIPAPKPSNGPPGKGDDDDEDGDDDGGEDDDD